MGTRTTAEIVRTALELAVKQGEFSTTELMTRLDANLSHSDIDQVLLFLQEEGWLDKSEQEPSVWRVGKTGADHLRSPKVEEYPFRVLPDEVPKDENHR
jgi:predicted transcriptional regulator